MAARRQHTIDVLALAPLPFQSDGATTFQPGDPTFAVPGGVLRPELVRPSGSLSLPS